MKKSFLPALLLLLLLCRCCAGASSSSSSCAAPGDGGGGVLLQQQEADPEHDRDDDRDDRDEQHEETRAVSSSSSSSSLEAELERAVRFRSFLRHMLDRLDDFYDRYEGKATHFDLQRFAVQQWLQYFGMDGDLVAATEDVPPLQENWLETLYWKTRRLAPAVLFSVWNDLDVFADDERDMGGPTDDELQVLLALDPSPLRSAQFDAQTNELVMDRPRLLQKLLQAYRHRGHMARVLATAWSHVLAPLEIVSYAIPSAANLALLGRYATAHSTAALVEVGAGTGYWSAALQWHLRNSSSGNNTTTYNKTATRSKDGDGDGDDTSDRERVVRAYDAFPPEPPQTAGQPRRNLYFEQTYARVRRGTCLDVFGSGGSHSHSGNATTTTLLLVWPNNPDNVDNAAAFRSDALPPVWDAACVRAFVARGGTTIVLVAERQINISLVRAPMTAAGSAKGEDEDDGTVVGPPPPDSGLSATRELQEYLRDNFDLVEQQPVLSWYYRDDLTVWRLKRQETPETTVTTTEAGAAVDHSSSDTNSVNNENIIIDDNCNSDGSA